MIKTNKYRYLGKNGIITTSVLLDGIEPILMYRLVADEGKALSDGNKLHKAVEIFAEDLDKWTEVDLEGQE